MTDPTDKIIKLMQTDESEDAPKEAILWSKNLFRTRAVEKSGVVSSLARLVKEISGNQLATGERSSASGTDRQMLFETDELSIDIRVAGSGESFTVKGQVLGIDEDEGLVSIGDQRARFDEFGAFEVAGLESGEYSITIKYGDSETIIERVRLG